MVTSAVFDKLGRTDGSPALEGEGHFGFLNRAQGPVFDRIRRLVDDWYQRYPLAGRADLRGRLRSDDDRAFIGAFWELYQAESLTRRAFEIRLHPDVPGTDRHPDFLADDGTTSFSRRATSSRMYVTRPGSGGGGVWAWKVARA